MDDMIGPGHNIPPEPTVQLDTLLELLKPEHLREILEIRDGEHATKRDALMGGVFRFIVQFADPSAIAQAETPPQTARDGFCVYLADETGPGRVYRFLSGEWHRLPYEKVISLLMPLVKINTPEIAGKAASFAKQIKATIKLVDAARVQAKAPFDEAGKTVQAYFKGGIVDPLDLAAKGIEGALSAYQTRLAEMERRTREEAAAKAKIEAQKALDAAIRTEHADLMDTAGEAAKAAEAAAQAATASTADMGRVKGDLGGVSAAREVWIFNVTDPAVVPREWLMIDEAKIRDFVKREKTAAIGAIPGVEVKSEIRASVR